MTTDTPTARVTLSGEFDLDGAPQVQSTLSSLAGQGITSVVVDVAGLTFVDSTGLRAILAGREKLQAAGATLVLEGASGVVERVLDMTGLGGLLAGDG
ncbi:MAG: STAS domain-containing protein [Acidimicrobiales bacterium]